MNESPVSGGPQTAGGQFWLDCQKLDDRICMRVLRFRFACMHRDHNLRWHPPKSKTPICTYPSEVGLGDALHCHHQTLCPCGGGAWARKGTGYVGRASQRGSARAKEELGTLAAQHTDTHTHCGDSGRSYLGTCMQCGAQALVLRCCRQQAAPSLRWTNESAPSNSTEQGTSAKKHRSDIFICIGNNTPFIQRVFLPVHTCTHTNAHTHTLTHTHNPHIVITSTNKHNHARAFTTFTHRLRRIRLATQYWFAPPAPGAMAIRITAGRRLLLRPLLTAAHPPPLSRPITTVGDNRSYSNGTEGSATRTLRSKVMAEVCCLWLASLQP